MLEPQKLAYQILCKNYEAQPQLTILNMAISDNNMEKKLYRILENIILPKWTQGLASFDKSVIVKHQVDNHDISDFIVEDTVKCITFKELLKNNSTDQVDLLQIDTEGYDFEIIKMWDLVEICPALISYESKHITMDKQRELTSYLASHGYKIFANGHDTIAYLGSMNRVPWESKEPLKINLSDC